jgi:hypothetical protein
MQSMCIIASLSFFPSFPYGGIWQLLLLALVLLTLLLSSEHTPFRNRAVFTANTAQQLWHTASIYSKHRENQLVCVSVQ